MTWSVIVCTSDSTFDPLRGSGFDPLRRGERGRDGDVIDGDYIRDPNRPAG